MTRLTDTSHSIIRVTLSSDKPATFHPHSLVVSGYVTDHNTWCTDPLICCLCGRVPSWGDIVSFMEHGKFIYIIFKIHNYYCTFLELSVCEPQKLYLTALKTYFASTQHKIVFALYLPTYFCMYILDSISNFSLMKTDSLLIFGILIDKYLRNNIYTGKT